MEVKLNFNYMFICIYLYFERCLKKSLRLDCY